MKLFTTALGLFTCSAGFASATLIYNGGDMAADANWTIRESAPGVDTTPMDGLLDGTANNGPVLTTDGNAAWQLNDQNTGGGFDLPQLKHEFDPATASDMATKGFSLTFRFENLGTRGGIWFGYDDQAGFAGSDQRLALVGVGSAATDGTTQTYVLSWDPNSSTMFGSLDGASPSALSFGNSSDNHYTGADNGSAMFLVDAGSSGNTGAAWNLVSADLVVVPEPGTFGLCLLGGVAVVLRRRFR